MCKGNQTSTSQTVNQVPPEVLAQYQKVVDRANTAAGAPYQSYNGQLTAGLTDAQTSAMSSLGDATQYAGSLNTLGNAAVANSGAYKPYFDQAQTLGNASAAAINPSQVSGSDISQYESPYQQDVINSTMAEAQHQDAVQQQGVMSDAIKQGNAFGGDRMGVAQAELARGQAAARNSTLANLNNQNFSQALGEANNQQQLGVAAQENNAARAGQAAGLMGTLGSAAQSNVLGSLGAAGNLYSGASGSALGAAQGLFGAGTVQQQTSQNDLNAQYQQFQNQVAFPYQQIGWLGNLSMGIGNSSGGTSTTTNSAPAPFFSDERVKEDIKTIGKTHDGMDIVRFRYKGRPEYQIGLIAQDVLKHHPETVSKYNGILAVDYKGATDKAASAGRDKYASGGGISGLRGTGLGDIYPGMDIQSAGSMIPQMTFPVGGGHGIPGAPQPKPLQASPLASAAENKLLGSGMDYLGKKADPYVEKAWNGLVSGFGSPPTTLGSAATPSSAGAMLAPSADPAASWGLGQAAGAQASGLGAVSSIPTAAGAAGDAISAAAPVVGDMGAAGAGAAGAADLGAAAAGSAVADAGATSLADVLPFLLFAKRGGRMPARQMTLADAPRVRRAVGGRIGYDDGGTVDPGLDDVVAYAAPDQSDNVIPMPPVRPADLGSVADSAPTGLGAAAGTQAPDPGNAIGAIGAATSPLRGREASISRTLGFEGGYTPDDAGKGPSNFGINQTANPDVDVRNLSQEQARQIYRDRYWNAIGGDELAKQDPALAHVAFDTSVIAGPERAKAILAASGGDPAKFMDLRQGFLSGLVSSNPEKYGQYAKSWQARDLALRQDIGAPAPLGNALAYSGEQPSATLRDAAPASNDNSLGSILSQPGMGKAVLAGLFGMLSSKSHSFLGALGEGGLTGIGSYNSDQDRARQALLANNAVANTGSEIATRKGQLGLGADRNKIAQQQLQRQQELNQATLGIQRGALDNATKNTQSEIDARRAAQVEKTLVPGVGWMIYDKAHPEQPPKFLGTDGSMSTTPPVQQPTAAAPGSLSANAPVAPVAPVAPGATTGPASPPPSAATGANPSPQPSPAATSGAPSAGWTPTTDLPRNFIPPNHINLAMNPNAMKEEQQVASKTLESTRAQANTARQALYRLDEMDQQIANLPKSGFLAQGSFATERANFAKNANAVVQSFGGQPIFDPSSVASIEQLAKDRFRLGAELSKSIGGREPGFIVQQAVTANPGADNSAMGYRRIVSGLRQAQMYDMDRAQFMDNYFARFNHLNGAETAFNQMNPPDKYSERAIVSTVDPRDAAALKENPKLAARVDAKYGAGVSKLLMGGQ